MVLLKLNPPFHCPSPINNVKFFVLCKLCQGAVTVLAIFLEERGTEMCTFILAKSGVFTCIWTEDMFLITVPKSFDLLFCLQCHCPLSFLLF